MSPSTHLEEASPELEVKPETRIETDLLELTEPRAVEAPKPARASDQPMYGSFRGSLLEYHRMKSGSRLVDTLISLAANVCLLILPVFAGLYFTDSIDLKGFATTFLVAPPPPPPPPAAAPLLKAAPVHRVFENAGKLIAPVAVPKQIAMLKEEPIPDADGMDGVTGGVPGGVAGGSMGGVLGGVIGGTGIVAPPAAPKEKGPRAPVRVGGRVKQPTLISRVDPKYPPLAIQTHLEGTVVVQAIIDEHGDVIEAKVVSGHPLLVDAALKAVRQWKYEPTYLNDQPIPVQLNVQVTFELFGGR